MPEPDSSVRVVDNPDRSRYEAYVGDELAGFVIYRKRPGVVVTVHTEVNAGFEGHGVGSRLALWRWRRLGPKAFGSSPCVRSSASTSSAIPSSPTWWQATSPHQAPDTWWHQGTPRTGVRHEGAS